MWFELTRGESTREKTRFEILKFLYENEGLQLFKNIEANCSESRGTVKKYMDELKDERLVEQSLRGRHPYFLSEKGKRYVKQELLRRDFYDLTDSFDIKWLEMLRNLLDGMRKTDTDPKVFFKDNCLAFIGGLPYTFPKSMEGMKMWVIDFEKGLEIRARKYGLTKEEYWIKKLKESVKMKGVPRILTSLGYTEEEIEELLKNPFTHTFKIFEEISNASSKTAERDTQNTCSHR